MTWAAGVSRGLRFIRRCRPRRAPAARRGCGRAPSSLGGRRRAPGASTRADMGSQRQWVQMCCSPRVPACAPRRPGARLGRGVARHAVVGCIEAGVCTKRAGHLARQKGGQRALRARGRNVSHRPHLGRGGRGAWPQRLERACAPEKVAYKIACGPPRGACAASQPRARAWACIGSSAAVSIAGEGLGRPGRVLAPRSQARRTAGLRVRPAATSKLAFPWAVV